MSLQQCRWGSNLNNRPVNRWAVALLFAAAVSCKAEHAFESQHKRSAPSPCLNALRSSRQYEHQIYRF